MLVTGASGGVGQAAVLLGKALGAVVVAAASSAEKAEAARALGADQAFVYPAEGADKASLTKWFKEQAGDRLFDVVCDPVGGRSEEHTSGLQSLMRISYAVFCLKKKTKTNIKNQ